MTELKTLKDFGTDLTYNTMEGVLNRNAKTQTTHKFYSLEELRQEAIKWVKKFKELNKIYEDDEDFDSDIASEFKRYSVEQYVRCAGVKYFYENTLNWIMDFFNLTEEDLQ